MRVRDNQEDEWRKGVVTCLDPIKVRLENEEQAKTWKNVDTTASVTEHSHFLAVLFCRT